MPKPNYGFEKRQRELEKKRKKEEKAAKKAAPPSPSAPVNTGGSPDTGEAIPKE
jgi:hypothetical protein